jgi:hypothetical protein
VWFLRKRLRDNKKNVANIVSERGLDFSSRPISLNKQLLPNATYVVLPGLDHGQSFLRSDIVLPHIKEFLAQVSNT